LPLGVVGKPAAEQVVQCGALLPCAVARRLDRIEKEPKDDLWEGYDPEKVREAVKKYTGTITEEEAKARIADLYRARKEGSRPADRSY